MRFGPESAAAIDHASRREALVDPVGVAFARIALDDDALTLDIVAVAVVEAVLLGAVNDHLRVLADDANAIGSGFVNLHNLLGLSAPKVERPYDPCPARRLNPDG